MVIEMAIQLALKKLKLADLNRAVTTGRLVRRLVELTNSQFLGHPSTGLSTAMLGEADISGRA